MGGWSPGRLLEVLRADGPRTRGQLAARTGLSRGTVTHLLSQLATGDLVAESSGTGARGRPPGVVMFSGDAGAVLAVDVDRTATCLAVTDLAARVLVEDVVELDLGDGPHAVMRVLRRRAERLTKLADRRDVWGVGVGLPGPFDLATGRLVAPAGLPAWADVAVTEMVESVFGMPSIVDNDVRVTALGEASVVPNADDVVVVKLGMGVGCALINSGVVQRGTRGAAGEIGHVAMASGTATCRCGNRGCLETVAGGWAILQRLQSAGLPLRTLDDVVAAVVAGEPTALAAAREAGRALGEVLAVVVSLVSPAVVILGGPLAAAGEAIATGVREMVYQRVTPLASEHLEIRTSDLGSRAGIAGAARLILDRVLTADVVDARVGRSETESA